MGSDPINYQNNAMWFVYILKCSDNSLYTGSTNDLHRRIEVHNSGKGAKYTRGRLPVELIYHEEHADKSLAMQREFEIKQWSRRQKETLMKIR